MGDGGGDKGRQGETDVYIPLAGYSGDVQYDHGEDGSVDADDNEVLRFILIK